MQILRIDRMDYLNAFAIYVDSFSGYKIEVAFYEFLKQATYMYKAYDTSPV